MLLYFWMAFQIIIESLPISSSGHVALLQKIFSYLEFSASIYPSWIIDFFLHGPTIGILIIYFFQQWSAMILHKNFTIFILFQKKSWQLLIPAIIFIFIVEAVTCFFWWLDLAHVLLIQLYFLPIGFIITMISLFFTLKKREVKLLQWSYRDALCLGIAQGLSLMPGISRFAMTYSVAKLLRYDNKTSFALSFLIELPLLCAGFFKSILYLPQYPELMAKLFSLQSLLVMVGVSCISYVVLCLVGYVIAKDKMWYFAWYMTVPLTLSLLM